MITPYVRLVRTAASAFLLLVGASAFAAQILVPAYFYPGPLWDQLANSASQVGIVAIANPNNGPGAAKDQNYANAINKLKTAGGRSIGYVSTRYAARPMAEVKADIDRWMSWYGGISGIFLDEMTNDNNQAHINYYRDLHAYVNTTYASRSFVVANPGTGMPEVYLTSNCADTFVIFEVNSGFGSWTSDAWVKPRNDNRFAVIPYAVSAGNVNAFADRAKAQGAGYIYITNDSGVNPWDTLPSYWSTLVSKVRTL